MNTLQQDAPRRRDPGALYRMSSKLAPRIAAWVRRRFYFDDLKQYEELTQLTHPSFVWMNFGLDGTDFTWLRPEDVEWKYQINMARHNLRGLDLAGKRFLDTGSGRGGNCWYIKRYHTASRVVGLDQSKAQVDWCRTRFSDGGIEFVRGDAQNLPFPAGSFDVVSNIESAGHYPDRRRFYRGVYRVLAPSGHFCMSCNFERSAVESQAIQKEGFELINETDITAAVATALEKNDENMRQLMQRITDLEETRQLGEGICNALARLPRRFHLRRETYYAWIFRKP
jgi:O-methyltransferase